MKNYFFTIFLFFVFAIKAQNNQNYIKTSQDLLTRIVNGESYEKEVAILEKSTLNDLITQLPKDKDKKVFWINIYNAFIQIYLNKNPSLFDNKGKFFKTKRIKIAGELLSFDDVEHGILRKSRCKISLGYLRKPFRSKWERKLRVDNIDWRIHFVLNCGAKSCPPVAIYSLENLNNELNYMATNYLKNHTTFNKKNETASSSALISWFRADFGGKSGARKILKNYEITPTKPKKIKFNNYDWTLYLNNFKELPKVF